MAVKEELEERYGFRIETADSVSALALLTRTPEPRDFATVTAFNSLHPGRFQLPDHVLQLLIKTADFRKHAYSYRNFAVAAGAWAVRDLEYASLMGFNVKADETDRINIHAEDMVIGKSDYYQYRYIPSLAVVGQHQHDQISGRPTNTLHTCGSYRQKMISSPQVTYDTLFTFALPDFTTIEYTDLDGLIRYHEDGDDSGITTARFDATPAVFAPLPSPSADGMYHLSEMEEVDDSDWQTAIVLPLMQRYFSKYVDGSVQTKAD
jgi:hypothetical protein